MSETEIEEALSYEGKLCFTFLLQGESLTFAKDYHAVLFYQGKYIQPTFKYNEEWADYDPLEYDVQKWRVLDEEDHREATLIRPRKYKAGFVYEFPLESVVDGEKVTIDPNGRVTLIAISPKGEETRFDFDLSKMR